MKNFLYPYQREAVGKMKNGCILNGGVGSGKSRTGLYFYFKTYGGKITDDEYVKMKDPADLYIITTAMKRDSLEWDGELANYSMSTKPEANAYSNKIIIDSWNNIKKYADVKNAFFIFDEQRVIGYGAWTKAFLTIAKSNKWIMLSATPGDTWTDYIPVFIANGFYKNKTDFIRHHVIYSPFTKYPKVDKYVNTGRLIKERKAVLVPMRYKQPTVTHDEYIVCNYDKQMYDYVRMKRWDIYNEKPVKNASGLCYVWRRICNEDYDRSVKVQEIVKQHPKVIIFYNFDYEREILLHLCYPEGTVVAERSGHKHDKVPDGDKWVYLVQYGAGSEAWNSTATDTIIFYSQNYSYRINKQASGRINRVNTPFSDLYYYHLVSKSKIDRDIYATIKRKKNFNAKAYVESQGIIFEKEDKDGRRDDVAV